MIDISFSSEELGMIRAALVNYRRDENWMFPEDDEYYDKLTALIARLDTLQPQSGGALASKDR